MIKKIDYIKNLAVFQDFNWNNSVKDNNNASKDFKQINVLYGRNYSGKTTLSRIFRALETGIISDKYDSPEFCLSFDDTQNTQIKQNNLGTNPFKVRVFNEDFIKDNLKFISNPEGSINPFAIIGESNNKIEEEVKALNEERGSNQLGKETKLYLKLKTETSTLQEKESKLNLATKKLDDQKKDKALDRNTGIKYMFNRFGDQNYTVTKLENEITQVLKNTYKPLTKEQVLKQETLLQERALDTISPQSNINLDFKTICEKASQLVSKEITNSGKIQELVTETLLNNWVRKGKELHEGKRSTCAFCNNSISQERWDELQSHFDEESEVFEQEIDDMINSIEQENKRIANSFRPSKELFYSKFHVQLEKIKDEFNIFYSKYDKSLNQILVQLNGRKEDLINKKDFIMPEDHSSDITKIESDFSRLVKQSNDFTSKLNNEQIEAKNLLRLNEVYDFTNVIKYADTIKEIEELKKVQVDAKKIKEQTIKRIQEIITEIESREALLKDESKGAEKVNDYLNNFFGHGFLSLKAIETSNSSSNNKTIRFEVVRDGKKAYHLSEGECSLIAFCYFMAKLEDIDTKGKKPIIWIDDPISSLDSNHIFFIYSIIRAEIVNKQIFDQLFISTHNLDFLKYTKRIAGKFLNANHKMQDFSKEHFIIQRSNDKSNIELMPKYLKDYVTEFNYLFHQIYKCSIETIDDSNHASFYNFGNNARKFLEIYLYYKYPDNTNDDDKLKNFFGNQEGPSLLTDRVNNEYSHFCGVFERGSTPIEVPEMKAVATFILTRIKDSDPNQYNSLLNSIGIQVNATPIVQPVTIPNQNPSNN